MGLQPFMYFIYLWYVMDNASIYNKREKCLKSIDACLKSSYNIIKISVCENNIGTTCLECEMYVQYHSLEL